MGIFTTFVVYIFEPWISQALDTSFRKWYNNFVHTYTVSKHEYRTPSKEHNGNGKSLRE